MKEKIVLIGNNNYNNITKNRKLTRYSFRRSYLLKTGVIVEYLRHPPKSRQKNSAEKLLFR